MSFFRRYLRRERERKKAERESSQEYSFFSVDKPGYLKVTRERIGLHEAEEFRKELMRYMETNTGSIILDMSMLDELDTAGIAVIMRAEKRAKQNRAHIRLSGLRGKPQSLLDMLCLGSQLLS